MMNFPFKFRPGQSDCPGLRGAFRPARKGTARPGASAAWYPPCLCRCHCPASGIYEIRSGLSVSLLFPDPHPHACPRNHGGFHKKEQLRLVVLSSASEAFSVLGKAYGIHTNGQNIGILLNTSIAEAELTAELKRLCSAISQRMQQTLSIDPFFSIVLCEQASPSYQKSWQLARRNLLFTSPETEDFMIIGHQEDLTSSLDPNLSIQLSRALIDRDQAVARKIADSFFPATWKQQTPRRPGSLQRSSCARSMWRCLISGMTFRTPN